MNDYIWLHYSLPRTDWFELAEAERAEHETRFEQVRQESATSGATLTGRFHVRGQGDFSHVEAWTFPTAQAAFDHWSRLVHAGYVHDYEFANQLGAADPASGLDEEK